MRIECARKDDVTIVAVTGELDVSTAPILQTHVKDLIEAGQVKLVFDFADLTHITSSGLAVLALSLQLVKPKNGAVVVAAAGGIVADVLAVWAGRKPQVVPSYASVDEALASLAEES